MLTLPVHTPTRTTMSDAVFLDTSGLLCIHDAADSRHPPAAGFYRNAEQLLITNYVFAEFVPLAQVRGMRRANALNFLKDLSLVPRIEVVWVDADLHGRALELLAERLDKTYSLCDAVSFLVMRQRGIRAALTTDRHFEQEGFIRLLEN